MSEILVNKLTGKTTANDITVTVGATATAKLEQGLAKVWSNQNLGTPNDSFNSSGITDNGTGNFTVNFSNAMSNINYSSTLGGADANTNASVLICVNNGTGFATGSINYFNLNEDTGASDYGPISCTVHGDLA